MMSMGLLVAVFFVSFVSIFICHFIAKRRGLRPVFWGVMGGLFGPLAIPFVYLAKPDLP